MVKDESGVKRGTEQPTKDGEPPARVRDQFKTLAFYFSLAAILFSGWTLWDSTVRSSIDVIVGKQVRLYVGLGFDSAASSPSPIIMASLSCVNLGGRAKVIQDSKLIVRIRSGEELKATMEFSTQREVDNFLIVEDDFRQHPVSPLLVMGKSMAVRQFVYAPSSSRSLPDMTKPVEVEFDLLVIYKQNWECVGTFEIDDLRGVWQDVELGPPYKAAVCLVSRTR